jgi:phosphatidylglycerophosphate synthase
MADKLLTLSTLVVLVGEGALRGWMVAVDHRAGAPRRGAGARLPSSAGVVIHARDLGKLKAWAQAVAAAIGGFAAAGAWGTTPAWWALLVALILTWVSGIDYARAARGFCDAVRWRASPRG